MDNLADFKKFVQSRPELSEAVKNQEYTWQGIYEMYALYGTDHAIWQDFKGKSVNSAGGGLDIASLLNLVRNLDLDALASALSGLEKVLGIVLSVMDTKEEAPSSQPLGSISRYDD